MSSDKSLFFPFLFLFFNLHFHAISTVPAAIQPFIPTRSPPTTTIPAFPEQSDLSGCSLNIPDQFFPNIKSACSTTKHGAASFGQPKGLHYSRCCPVLAAWLFAAYSDTALGRAGRVGLTNTMTPMSSSSYDLPQLPDDSETCVENLEKAMKERKMELIRPNETCDVVYCYCGIRLHPLSCPGAFWVNEKGKMVGDEKVKKLEGDCLTTNGVAGCSKCLHTLYQLHGDNTSSKSEDIHSNKDCQLMGLTWLLAKNTSAYVHTVSSVLRALMMTSHPLSCTLNTDGLPLAVDSAEISHHSLASPLISSLGFSLVLAPLLYMLHTVSSI